eukprot:3925657-Amphidinium_carterae.1
MKEKSPEMGISHILDMFPMVASVVYVMRHPLTARIDYIRPACEDVRAIGLSLDHAHPPPTLRVRTIQYQQ